MKSIIISLLLLTFGTVPSGATVFEPVIEEETIVDDIPFDTQWILIHEGMLPAFELEEEEYIDDIPFNTEEITRNVLLTRMEQDYSDEAGVDDIPFSTEAIALEYKLEEMYHRYAGEKFSDDIPFHASWIASEYFLERAVEDFRNAEISAGFSPETGELFCQGYKGPCDKQRSVTRGISNDKYKQYIELEAQGYDITRYLDKIMETIERLHIQSPQDYEKKIFYLNHSFDAL